MGVAQVAKQDLHPLADLGAGAKERVQRVEILPQTVESRLDGTQRQQVPEFIHGLGQTLNVFRNRAPDFVALLGCSRGQPRCRRDDPLGTARYLKRSDRGWYAFFGNPIEDLPEFKKRVNTR